METRRLFLSAGHEEEEKTEPLFYLSKIIDAKLTKVYADFQKLIALNLIESQNRLYFRIVEDTNKNGKFDSKDVVHYNYIDLANKDWKVESYNPI